LLGDQLAQVCVLSVTTLVSPLLPALGNCPLQDAWVRLDIDSADIRLNIHEALGESLPSARLALLALLELCKVFDSGDERLIPGLAEVVRWSALRHPTREERDEADEVVGFHLGESIDAAL
jgi:hypothetical protein